MVEVSALVWSSLHRFLLRISFRSSSYDGEDDCQWRLSWNDGILLESLRNQVSQSKRISGKDSTFSLVRKLSTMWHVLVGSVFSTSTSKVWRASERQIFIHYSSISVRRVSKFSNNVSERVKPTVKVPLTNVWKKRKNPWNSVDNPVSTITLSWTISWMKRTKTSKHSFVR